VDRIQRWIGSAGEMFRRAIQLLIKYIMDDFSGASVSLMQASADITANEWELLIHGKLMRVECWFPFNVNHTLNSRRVAAHASCRPGAGLRL
jgi:hypothetical protein